MATDGRASQEGAPLARRRAHHTVVEAPLYIPHARRLLWKKTGMAVGSMRLELRDGQRHGC